MNNQAPFFNPLNVYQNQFQNENYEKLINKINRLEKTIRILENKINKLEKEDNKIITQNEPTDMYMI